MNSFLKKRGLNRMDLCYLAALTLIGLGIRFILRVVITDDWLMYWDPWISDLKEMGFSYLATDRYDYTPTFVYILWAISRLPIRDSPPKAAAQNTALLRFSGVVGQSACPSQGSSARCFFSCMVQLPFLW